MLNAHRSKPTWQGESSLGWPEEIAKLRAELKEESTLRKLLIDELSTSHKKLESTGQVHESTIKKLIGSRNSYWRKETLHYGSLYTMAAVHFVLRSFETGVEAAKEGPGNLTAEVDVALLERFKKAVANEIFIRNYSRPNPLASRFITTDRLKTICTVGKNERNLTAHPSDPTLILDYLLRLERLDLESRIKDRQLKATDFAEQLRLSRFAEVQERRTTMVRFFLIAIGANKATRYIAQLGEDDGTPDVCQGQLDFHSEYLAEAT
ncbi:hypothetical protein IAR55_005216 [Kwoniella newhampshirensis]|uniref:Uncharacterized protein n=1 Tax=Kwoniella newhampshirensis TaxID=1651941 RepID=A0AAW0YLJ6_9TREE